MSYYKLLRCSIATFARIDVVERDTKIPIFLKVTCTLVPNSFQYTGKFVVLRSYHYVI